MPNSPNWEWNVYYQAVPNDKPKETLLKALSLFEEGNCLDKKDNEYLFSNNKSLLSIDRICHLLSQSYWANTRTREKIELSVNNSICFGVYYNDIQVGFARVVTDFAAMYWLCDVMIDEKHRGKGLGKKLVEYIVNSEELQGLRGILRTKDAHGLYEQYGYVKDGEHFMVRE